MTIAVCDFNAAVAVPWNTTTCLIAQACARTFNGIVQFCGFNGPHFFDGRTVDVSREASLLAQKFDEALNMGLERKVRLYEIRRALPLEVEVTVRSY